MKKFAVILTVIGASVFSTQVKAQSKSSAGDFHFAAGVRLGLPVGDYHPLYGFGIGGQLQGEYSFTENITGVATTGYTNFFGKDLGGGVKANNVGLIPIIVGPRFYPTENIFIGAQLGLGVLTGGGSSTSGFDYNPEVGYNADNFQVIFAYNGLPKNGTNFSHLGLSFLYKFGGSK